MTSILILLAASGGMVLFAWLAGNPAGHATPYRRRRLFNWLPLGLTYSFLYMGRYNLTVSKNAFGALMTKEQFGIIFFCGTVTYACSFLINGPLTDRIGGKKAIVIGAYGSALMNGLLGLVTYLVLTVPSLELNLVAAFSLIYAVNMYFQSYGAVAIVKVNSNWFHIRERGGFSGIFGVLISLGIFFAFDWSSAIVAAVHPVAQDLGPFQVLLRAVLGAGDQVQSGANSAAYPGMIWWVFFLPAALLAIFATIDVMILRDSPTQAGFKDFDVGDGSEHELRQTFSVPQLLKRILSNKTIWIIGGIEFCSGVLRNGVMHWYPIYLNENDIPRTFFFREHWGAILCVAGILGGIVAGFISDKVFGSRRGPVAALLYGILLAASATMVFVIEPTLPLGVVVSVMSLAAIGVHGMLSGTATMDFGGRRGAATAVGLIDGFVYLGTGLQSISLGFITSRDWSQWPVFMVPFAALGLFLAIRIWRAFPDNRRK
jgi:OPA family glycerol-3-phosphate transporter-like MFS transporter